MIFHSEIFEEIKISDIKKAYLKVSRPDGKLDLSLQKIGAKNDKTGQEKILTMLKENKGRLAYNYKSDPEDIKNVFGLSKKAYKRALTALVEEQKIEVKDNGISLR